MGLLALIITTATIGIAGIVAYSHYGKDPTTKGKWLAITAIIFAIWSLCTCWMWFYYFCLYLSAPALLISIVLFFKAKRFEISKPLFRVLMLLYISIFLLTIASALFFNIL